MPESEKTLKQKQMEAFKMVINKCKKENPDLHQVLLFKESAKRWIDFKKTSPLFQ